MLLVAAAAPTLQASILVAERAPRASMWKDLYQQLPEKWKSRGTILVREVSDEEMDRLLVAETDGEYDPRDEETVVQAFFDRSREKGRPDAIIMRRSIRDREAAFIFTHEYGHYVWDTQLTRAQKREYTELWEERRDRRRLVTPYAMESVEEGFSEAFATYLRNPEKLKSRDMESYDFLHTLRVAPREEQARK
jgi:hypothetical protein